jgi:hypothetical protein
MTTGLTKAMRITGRILAHKKFSDVDARVIKGLLEGDLTVQYHHVLPRDQAAVVERVDRRFALLDDSASRHENAPV